MTTPEQKPFLTDFSGNTNLASTQVFVTVPADSDSIDPHTLIRYDQFVGTLFKGDTRVQMLNHAALGVCGEAGELADAIKKHVHYGMRMTDVVKGTNQTLLENLIEELGDLQFYIQAVQNLFNIPDQVIYQANADKLSKRYAGLKYTDAAAQLRADKAGE